MNLTLTYSGNTLPADITQQLINYAELELNVPPSYLITKLHYEGLWGGSAVARDNNNWGGMTWNSSWTSPHTRASGVIVTRGTPRPANEGGHYIKYASVQDFLVDWNHLIRRGGIYNVADSETFQDAVKGMFVYGGAQYDYATMNVEGSQLRYELYLQGMQARRNAINQANNNILDTLDAEDHADEEIPEPSVPDAPDESTGGIDLVKFIEQFNQAIEQMLTRDIVKSGRSEYASNAYLTLIEQLKTGYKIKPNQNFFNAITKLFDDFNEDYVPPQPDPDPEDPEDPEDPDPPVNNKVFPVRIQNGVNFFRRSDWGVGTVQRNMTYGSRSTGGHHFGYDIGGGTNEAKPIYSVRSGTVRKAEFRNGIGNAVTIEQEDYFVEYGHLNSYSVNVGDTVEAGQQIGTMGATGGPYDVHLDIKIATTLNGFYAYETTIDPEKYLQVTGTNQTSLPQP